MKPDELDPIIGQLVDRGIPLVRDAEYRTAKPLLRAALLVADAVWRPNDARRMPILEGLALALNADRTEAHAELEEAIQLLRRNRILAGETFSDESFHYARAIEPLARLLEIAERYDEALDLYRHVLVLYEQERFVHARDVAVAIVDLLIRLNASDHELLKAIHRTSDAIRLVQETEVPKQWPAPWPEEKREPLEIAFDRIRDGDRYLRVGPRIEALRATVQK